VINFSVKSYHNNRNFGPRPQETIISNKMKYEENKEAQQQNKAGSSNKERQAVDE